MDAPRPSSAEVLAGVGGLILATSLFLPWYRVSLHIAEFRLSKSGSGWEALGFVDLILLAISIAAVAIVAARMAGRLPADIPAGATLLGVGTVALLLVLLRIVDIPVDGQVADGVTLTREAGIFIALLGSACLTFGGWRTHKRPTAARGEGRRRRVGAEGGLIRPFGKA